MSEQSLTLEVELAARLQVRERRIAVRYLPDQQTSCQMIVGLERKVWQAIIRNLSECGIGFLLSQPLEPGTLLALELDNPPHQLCRTLLAVVIRAQADASGDWLIGCQFASLLTRDELLVLCDLAS
jgi:hypothetical protein